MVPFPHVSPEAFAALAAELHREPDEVQTALAIVNRMKELVPGADEVSMTIRTRRGRHKTLAASDALAAAADGLQYLLDEGPCVEITDSGGWLRSRDVSVDARWPHWGPQASTMGVGSMLSIAIVEHGQPCGALNVYSRALSNFTERDVVDIALIYAIHATNALSAARLASSLQTAVSSRHTIGMAQGILMERYRMNEHQSFELLRRLSSSTNVKLRDVAAQIVDTRQLPGVIPATSLAVESSASDEDLVDPLKA